MVISEQRVQSLQSFCHMKTSNSDKFLKLSITSDKQALEFTIEFLLDVRAHFAIASILSNAKPHSSPSVAQRNKSKPEQRSEFSNTKVPYESKYKTNRLYYIVA